MFLITILGSLKIMAEVFVNENMIGQTETTVTFSDSATPPPTEEPIADEDKSQFTVTKAVEQSCIERVDGMDSATYTITVNNGKTTPDSLTSIKDKLPLGFVYIVNSSILNGTATPDSGLVTVNQIGRLPRNSMATNYSLEYCCRRHNDFTV